MLIVVLLSHAVVLFHAAETIIDAVEWPDVQVLGPITELASLVEQVDWDASNY